MSRYTVVRLIESFFRRWWLYLLPVVLLGLVGAATAAGTKDTYRSIGTLSVASSTLVEKLSNISTSPNYGYDSPAVATSKSLIQRLQTQAFVTDVAQRAGITGAVSSGILTLPQLRQSIAVWADGTNLFHVSVTMSDPVVAQRVAAATIAAFQQNVLDANLADSAAAIAFWDAQATTYQGAVATARGALNAYLQDHPATSSTATLDDRSVQITQLQSDLSQAQARYDSAVAKREEARLVSEQTKADIGNRLGIVDEPALPTAREPKLRGMATTFAMFVVIGLILAAAGVVVATAFDRGLRTQLDIRERLGVRPLASIPDVGAIPVVTGVVAVRPRRVSEVDEPVTRRRVREEPAEWEVPVTATRPPSPLPTPAAIHPGGPRAPRVAGGGVGNSRRSGAFMGGRRGPSE